MHADVTDPNVTAGQTGRGGRFGSSGAAGKGFGGGGGLGGGPGMMAGRGGGGAGGGGGGTMGAGFPGMGAAGGMGAGMGGPAMGMGGGVSNSKRPIASLETANCIIVQKPDGKAVFAYSNIMGSWATYMIPDGTTVVPIASEDVVARNGKG